MLKIFGLFIAICALTQSLNAQTTCATLGTLQTFLDPTCAQGGAGCNAGGQGQNCRFCGFDIFPPCPSAATTTQGTTTTRTTGPTTTKTTTVKTTKETTTRDPNSPNPDPVICNDPVVEPEYNEYGEKLIFSDEFDTMDFKKWKHDMTMSGGGNWEFQLYHNNRTNSFVKDGIFHIKPTLTEDRIGLANLKSNYRMDMWGGSPADECTGNNFYGCERQSGAGGNILNPIQSAKITTATTFNFKFGRVEVVAKLPKGDWLWPAIWMLPARNEYGMWPASGEIDIMESRGNVNYPISEGGGVESFGSTLHWGADWTQNRYDLTTKVYSHSSKLSDEFHTYGLYWSDDRLYTYFDDPKNIILDVDFTDKNFWDFGKFPSSYENPWVGAANSAPFNKDYYLIINLAVGGVNYFSDKVPGKPWRNDGNNAVNDFYNAKNQWFPTWQNPDVSLQIDSVKVWALPEDKKK